MISPYLCVAAQMRHIKQWDDPTIEIGQLAMNGQGILLLVTSVSLPAGAPIVPATFNGPKCWRGKPIPHLFALA